MTELANLSEARSKLNEQRRKLRAAERAAGISADDVHRANMAERSREESRVRAEIGAPPLRDDELWQRYRLDLWLFLTENFPNSLGLTPLCDEQHRIINRLQQTILYGGQDLTIMFRGGAKSTTIECAAIWATGYGHRNFFVPLGATAELTKSSLESIQYEFEENEQLMLLFPEVCHAARAIEGIPQRSRKQTIDGRPTRIEWSRKRIVLPTVKGFPGSGAIIWPRPIMSRGLRGTRFKRPDGTQARPDFVCGDDLQTDDSAKHPGQTKKRIDILRRVVLRLAGHRRRLAVNVIGTILENDDMLDQLTRDKSWRVMRVPMLKSYSDAHEEWINEYAQIRTSYNPDDDADKERAERDATAYYVENRDRLDAGAVATWEHCLDPECEVSAIQHAYNIICDSGFEAFSAECQSAPIRQASGLSMLSPDAMARKQSTFKRRQVPAACQLIASHVDVHDELLYWEAWGFTPNGTSYKIDEGYFPEQPRNYFQHRSIPRKLSDVFPGRDLDAVLTAGLNGLLHGHESWPGLMRYEWSRVDGVPMRVGPTLVDANGVHRDLIVGIVSASPYAGQVRPAYGKGVLAKHAPMSSWPSARKQSFAGPEWVLTEPVAGEVQGVLFDTNFWKTRFHRALALADGSQGAAYLYKADPASHRMAVDHYLAEIADEVSHGSRTVHEFRIKPNVDNHKFDNGVGCFVAASCGGIGKVTKQPARRRRRIVLKER